MAHLSKVSYVERQEYCNNVYIDCIFNASEFLSSCEEAVKVLKIYLPRDCYTNFRDALFHFYRMTKCDEESAMLSQAASVMEHSNRAVRDAEVAVCMRCASVLYIILSRNKFELDIKKTLNNQLDIMKEWILMSRMNGMMLEKGGVISGKQGDFLEMVEKFFSCLEQCARGEFRDTINYLYDARVSLQKELETIVSESSVIRDFKACTTYDDVANIVYNAIYGRREKI